MCSESMLLSLSVSCCLWSRPDTHGCSCHRMETWVVLQAGISMANSMI